MTLQAKLLITASSGLDGTSVSQAVHIMWMSWEEENFIVITEGIQVLCPINLMQPIYTEKWENAQVT